MENNSRADLKSSLIDLEADNTATGGKLEFNSLQPERLNEKNNNYILYWIHLPNHDIMTEGYIGITKNINERFKAHKKNKYKTHFTHAIKKYDWNNLIKDIIQSNLSLEDALKLENFYRPDNNIGWNSLKGGTIGVDSDWYLNDTNKEKHKNNTSIATKEAIKLKDSKEARANRAKQCWKNGIYKDVSKGSKNPRALLNEEQVYEIKSNHIPNKMSNDEIANIYNVKPYVINQIRIEKNWKHVVVCDSPAHK